MDGGAAVGDAGHMERKTMNLSDLPSVLRDLADRFEQAGLEDTSVRVEISASTQCQSREDLARWLPLVGDSAQLHRTDGVANAWIASPIMSDVRITRHFKPGLLGGREVVTLVDDTAGLVKLREEFAGKVLA
jgi:hypothetical protein